MPWGEGRSNFSGDHAFPPVFGGIKDCCEVGPTPSEGEIRSQRCRAQRRALARASPQGGRDNGRMKAEQVFAIRAKDRGPARRTVAAGDRLKRGGQGPVPVMAYEAI